MLTDNVRDLVSLLNYYVKNKICLKMMHLKNYFVGCVVACALVPSSLVILNSG